MWRILKMLYLMSKVLDLPVSSNESPIGHRFSLLPDSFILCKNVTKKIYRDKNDSNARSENRSKQMTSKDTNIIHCKNVSTI